MNYPPFRQPHRERILRSSGRRAETCEQPILQMLLAHDGSTTRMLEMSSGEKVSVQTLEQHVVRELPRELAGALPGTSFLRRVTALEAQGHVLLDSLSYIAIDALPVSVNHKLQEGITPIGHVLSRLCTRRRFRSHDAELFKELWNAVGYPDPEASCSSCIYTARGPALIVGETFRRGALSLLSTRRNAALNICSSREEAPGAKNGT